MKVNATQLDSILSTTDTFEKPSAVNTDSFLTSVLNGASDSTVESNLDSTDDSDSVGLAMQSSMPAVDDEPDAEDLTSLVTAMPQQVAYASLDAPSQVQTSAAALNGTGGSLILSHGTATESTPSISQQQGLPQMDPTVLANLRGAVAQLPAGAQRDALLGQLDLQLGSSNTDAPESSETQQPQVQQAPSDAQQQQLEQQQQDQQLQDQVLQQELQFQADRRTNKK